MSKICCICNEELGQKSAADLGGKFVHIDCFKCTGCEQPIDLAAFQEKEGKYYCQPCFMKDCVAPCTACDKPLEGEFMKVNDQFYHKDCFICSECQHAINSKYFILEGKPCCNACWEAQSSKCFICKEKVVDKKIVAAHNIIFHPTCFKCKVCEKEIGEGDFVPKGDLVYHVDCYKQETGEEEAPQKATAE